MDPIVDHFLRERIGLKIPNEFSVGHIRAVAFRNGSTVEKIALRGNVEVKTVEKGLKKMAVKMGRADITRWD